MASTPIPLTRRAAVIAAAATAVLAGLPGIARAADYPAKPVTLVVNFPPGGGALNLMVRALADQATRDLGQPVVVDYKAGAGGNIGAQYVANAKPDGYTLLAAVDTTLTVNPSVYASMPFDADKAFAPLATFGTFSQMLVGHDATRVKVQHRCHVQPAFGRPDVGEVGHPLLVRCISLELAVQHVVGNRTALAPVLG